MAEPKWVKSKTDKEEPKRPMPYIEMDEPFRVKHRKDTVEPKETKSKIDKELPKVTQL